MQDAETLEAGIPVIVERGGRTSRAFNVGAELSEHSIHTFRMPMSARPYGFEDIGTLGRNLLRTIESTVPGVEEVYLKRYSLTVVINVTFSWDTVEPGILAAIETAVGPIDVRQPELAFEDFFVVFGSCGCTCDDDGVVDDQS